MKNKLHGQYINRPRCRQRHKHIKYEKHLGKIISICIKQRLSNSLGLALSKNFSTLKLSWKKAEAVVRRCSVKKVFLEILQSLQENACVRVSILIKLQTEACKRLWHRCFSVNFAKFIRTPFLTEQLWWLLLKKALLIKKCVHIHNGKKQKP